MKLRAIIVFYLIAPVYALIFGLQAKKYAAIVKKISERFDLRRNKSIVDLGCGNGALCSAFNQYGFDATGVDAMPSMIAMAKNNLKNTEVRLVRADILKKLPFEDKSFDIAISSYVLHGMKKDEREQLYNEMSRIARNAVIFHEYNQNRNVFTNIIEWIEGGDYFAFIKVAGQEMKQYFGQTEMIDVDKRAAWYINTI